MVKSFIKHIASEFKSYSKSLLLVKNPDAFLKREEVKLALSKEGIRVFDKEGIALRVDFELVYKNDPTNTLYIITATNGLVEDIKAEGVVVDFQLSAYFTDYHATTILDCTLSTLELLFAKKPDSSLNKKETERYIATFSEVKQEKFLYDIAKFRKLLSELLAKDKKDWYSIILLTSTALVETIEGKLGKEILESLIHVNNLFQVELKKSFKQSINSNAIKKPRVVSKIQDHLAYHYKEEKVALVVVDGMAYWQYLLLKKKLSSFVLKEDITYSWIPSITQLSRQAIFKGGIPDNGYIQNPKNEKRLWFTYWEDKGLQKYQIRYNHENIDTTGLERITKFGIVYKDLDEKMHSSSDYVDLKKLTENWIERSRIVITLKELVKQGFLIFLTTDHGNISANGWRNLKGKEKLGTNKSGSRSARHIEYSEQWIADDFLNSNPELKNAVVQDEKVIYLTNNLSFSNKKELVTHGGSHLLEVLVPFVKIKNG